MFARRDLDKMKEGIGEKVAIFINLVSSFTTSIIISFIYGWKLTLVVLSCAPVIVIATAVVAKVQSSLSALELAAYGQAGTVAEEVLSSIRTVVAFNGEQKEVERYTEKLEPAEKTGIRRGLWSGVGGGVMWLIIYLSYALAFWYASFRAYARARNILSRPISWPSGRSAFRRKLNLDSRNRARARVS